MAGNCFWNWISMPSVFFQLILSESHLPRTFLECLPLSGEPQSALELPRVGFKLQRTVAGTESQLSPG
jgi:hypothetical protein